MLLCLGSWTNIDQIVGICRNLMRDFPMSAFLLHNMCTVIMSQSGSHTNEHILLYIYILIRKKGDASQISS